MANELLIEVEIREVQYPSIASSDVDISISTLTGVDLGLPGGYSMKRKTLVRVTGRNARQRVDLIDVTVVAITTDWGNTAQIYRTIALIYPTHATTKTYVPAEISIVPSSIGQTWMNFLLTQNIEIVIKTASSSTAAAYEVAVIKDLPSFTMPQNADYQTKLSDEMTPVLSLRAHPKLLRNNRPTRYANAFYTAAMFAAINLHTHVPVLVTGNMPGHAPGSTQPVNALPTANSSAHLPPFAFAQPIPVYSTRQRSSKWTKPREQVKVGDDSKEYQVKRKSKSAIQAMSETSLLYKFEGENTPVLLSLPEGWTFAEAVDEVVLVLHEGKPSFLHVLADVENVSDDVRRFIADQAERLLALSWAYKLVVNPPQDDEDDEE